MLVPPARQARFREQMAKSDIIPIGMDTDGSTILRG
jgi:hypothetical protein